MWQGLSARIARQGMLARVAGKKCFTANASLAGIPCPPSHPLRDKNFDFFKTTRHGMRASIARQGLLHCKRISISSRASIAPLQTKGKRINCPRPDPLSLPI